MSMMEESVKKVEQQKAQQVAWLAEYEANKDSREPIMWVERESEVSQRQHCEVEAAAEEHVKQQGSLEVRKAEAAVALVAPTVIEVIAYEPEDLFCKVAADSSSIEAAVDCPSGGSSSSSDGIIVSALVSLVFGLHFAVYNIMLSVALVDAVFTAVVSSPAAAVAASSCRRLSGSLSGSFRTLVSPRSSVDAV